MNIPAEKGIKKFFDASDNPDNNWYFYLFDLGIINRDTYDKIIQQQAVITDNLFLSAYLNEITNNYVLKDNSTPEFIADFGCGYGFMAFWIAQFTGKKIYAIGYPRQISVLKKIYQVAKEKGLIEKNSEIHFLAQPLNSRSVLLDPSIKPASLDKIILNNVIEHFHPTLYYNLCLSSYNSLKQGGILISKSPNSDNSTTLNRLKFYWESCETDYLEKARIELIREKYQLKEEDLQRVAESTRGYTLQALDSAITYFKTTGNLLPHNQHLVPINISMDNYMLENYVSPEFFKTFLSFFGFTTTLIPGLYSSRRLSIFSPLAKVWPRTLLKIKYFSEVIIIKAVKN